MKPLRAIALLLALSLPVAARAHHGVASLGLAGLQGPGAPIETSSSATLPKGGVLAYVKLDYARFQTFTSAIDDEGEYNAFWMYGLGYGVTPYLSLYGFVPFYTKKPEDSSFTSSGFADIALMGVLGWAYDGRLHLVPPNESLDDMEDWHFTLYGGGTLPTGKADLRSAAGVIDPGMSLGFGQPSLTGGLSATKQLSDRVTAVLDASIIGFRKNEYADGQRMRFGTETRLNAALPVRILTAAGAAVRLDACLEANYLALGRDRANGIGERATGGRILYAVPGARLYVRKSSVGLGVKLPAWTDLNEEDQQQGAEGKEEYRLLVTFSTLL